MSADLLDVVAGWFSGDAEVGATGSSWVGKWLKQFAAGNKPEVVWQVTGAPIKNKVPMVELTSSVYGVTAKTVATVNAGLKSRRMAWTTAPATKAAQQARAMR
jgi:hypothetical protein